jgi:protein involved in polysaccharide export with SLBB domain
MNLPRLLLLPLALALALPPLVQAEDPAPAAITQTAVKPAQRAAWQERFTLGPGDQLGFSLFDTNEMTRTEMVIGPDGRLSFLEAENIPAAGLTVDELRVRFDAELSKFYRNPHTIITPVAYRSKKYFVLGSVMQGGIFPMDRPTTVIEAVARAGGLETGVYQRGTVELADLSHSFLARNGARVPVDFERLFQRGDLSQNTVLEPGDYLYIASAHGNEIYVLGEVMVPGVLAYAQKPTVVGAIASRGGFGPKAYKSRVLVVRGSLTHPQTFVVDTSAIVAGKAPDFKLQSKDIVFVNVNQWLKAADVLDTAAKAFMQAFTVEATSLHVGPLITSPIIK